MQELRILGVVFFCGLLVVVVPFLVGIYDQDTWIFQFPNLSIHWLLKTTCHAFYFDILQVNKYEFNLDEPAYHDKEQGTCRIASGFGNI